MRQALKCNRPQHLPVGERLISRSRCPLACSNIRSPCAFSIGGVTVSTSYERDQSKGWSVTFPPHFPENLRLVRRRRCHSPGGSRGRGTGEGQRRKGGGSRSRARPPQRQWPADQIESRAAGYIARSAAQS